MPYEEVEIPERESVDHTPTYKNHVCKQNFRNKRIKYPQGGGFFSEQLKNSKICGIDTFQYLVDSYCRLSYHI